jgi:hypothetical protein
MRGIAHIAVLKALEEYDLKPYYFRNQCRIYYWSLLFFGKLG